MPIDGQIGWHLDRKVPIGIILAILLQTFFLVVWGTKLDSRVGVLELNDPKQDARLTRLEDIGTRVAVMEEKQNTMLDRMKIQTVTMQEILGIVSKINKQ